MALKVASGVTNPHLEFPENEEFGDYSTNVAMQSGGNSRTAAEKIVVKLRLDKDLTKIVEKIEIAGPGFINFWLKNDTLVDNLKQIDIQKEKYGTADIGNDKTVVIDYSSPNIAKPFGIGHLRSTIIGQALYNFYKFLGYEVVGDNHLGDWGTQFGKLLFMIDKTKTEDFSIENLEKLYVEFHEHPDWEEDGRAWFKRLEDGDSQARKIWQKCVDVSIKEFDRIYSLLGVKIDFTFGESYYEQEMKAILANPKVGKYLSEGESGTKIVDLTKQGIKTPLMFLKGDGATTYAARDLATIIFRVRKWDPDIIIYEVGTEQTLHFRQIFAAAKLMGLVKEKTELVHTAHGLYLSPGGKKFSTRKGETIKLEEVLNEAVKRAEKLGNKDGKIARQVGLGAVKYFDLMHSVSSSVVFDWEKMMNLEGNSGPYLQYTVARANSVLARAPGTQNTKYDIQNDEELAVLRSLTRFSEIIASAAKIYSPNLLCNYLYDLAQKFNTFYNKHRIIGAENEEFRLLLTTGTGQVLKNGLGLLGIETPERM